MVKKQKQDINNTPSQNKLFLFFQKRADLFLIIFVFLVALIPRIFLYHTEFWRTPDGIEYLNVAQNINRGLGLTQSIKWFFFNPSPVVTSALFGRPLLTSIIFSGLLRIHNDPYFLQAFELVLDGIDVVLFYMLARKFYRSFVSGLAAFLLALNPNFLISNRLILSEPICIFFVLIFFLVYFRKNESAGNYLLLGGIAGICYLARFEGFLLLLTLVVFRGWKNWKIVISVFAFVVVNSWYFYLNYQVHHTLFYSYNTYHFQVKQFSEGMWNGFGKTYPTSVEFVRNNFSWIIKAVFNLTVYNIKSLLSLPFMGLLTLLYFIVYKKAFRVFGPMVLFSVLYLGLLSIIWAGYTEPERHFTIIYPFLLLPIFCIFDHRTFERLRLTNHILRITKVRIALLIFLLTLGIYVGYDIHRVVWARTIEPTLDNKGYEDKKAVYEWITANTFSDSIIAESNPWTTYRITNHPSIMLPRLRSKKQANDFIREYHVDYIISSRNNAVFADFPVAFSHDNLWVYCGFSCLR